MLHYSCLGVPLIKLIAIITWVCYLPITSPGLFNLTLNLFMQEQDMFGSTIEAVLWTSISGILKAIVSFTCATTSRVCLSSVGPSSGQGQGCPRKGAEVRLQAGYLQVGQ